VNHVEQADFVSDLIANVTQEILSKIEEMPEHWDGHELRRFIADRFEDANMGALTRADRPNRNRRRIAVYRKAVLTLNL